MRLPTLALLAATLILANFTIVQTAGAAYEEKEREKSGIHHHPHSVGPIVVKWPMKKLDGSANLIVNPDGSYLFSGTVRDKLKDRDFDIAIALKSSLGAVIVFHFSGDASRGVQWSKQGHSPILKDNFKTFADSLDWTGEYSHPLSSKGVAKLYQEREQKKDQMRKEEAEARRGHKAKVAAQKKEEREKQEREELAEANTAVQTNQQSGGGSNVGADIVSVASTVGSVVGAIGSVGKEIAGLF